MQYIASTTTTGSCLIHFFFLRRFFWRFWTWFRLLIVAAFRGLIFSPKKLLKMPQTNSFWWCTYFLIRRTVIFNTNFALYYFIYICLCILLTAEMGKSTKPTSLRPIESKLHQLKEEKEKKKQILMEHSLLLKMLICASWIRYTAFIILVSLD